MLSLEMNNPTLSLTDYIWENIQSVPLDVDVLKKYNHQSNKQAKQHFDSAIKNVQRKKCNKKNNESSHRKAKSRIRRGSWQMRVK
jgi:hypothetical protein